MAVTITTKFYEEDSPAWHDLSKVVFTSPNMTSPQTVGTRSHILPGQDDLGLWYEDSSNMYKIESIQDTYDTSFYYYYADLDADYNIDIAPATASIGATNHPNLVDFVRDASSVEVTGFEDTNADITDTTLKLEYTVVTDPIWTLDYIHSDNITTTNTEDEENICTVLIDREPEWGGPWEANTLVQRRISETSWLKGWKAEVISDIQECYIDFEFLQPTKITYMYMRAMWSQVTTWTWDCDEAVYDASESVADKTYYFIGDFEIQGKTDTLGASWVSLYTGTNTTNIDKDIFMLGNTNYYTYYRILINDNSTLTTPAAGGTFDDTFYGISSLILHGNEYSTDPGTDYLIMYDFDDDDVSRELHVTNALPVAGTPFPSNFDESTAVQGTVFITPVSGTGTEITQYDVDVDNALDFRTSVTGNATTTSGSTATDECTGYTEIAQDDAVLTGGYMSVEGEAGLSGASKTQFSCEVEGVESGITYSNSLYNITTTITYTTNVSGTLPEPGHTGSVDVVGITRRQESRSSEPRAASYDLTVSDTTNSGIISSGISMFVWGFRADLTGVEFSTTDSVTFEVTSGEAYDCRLTAWDDSSHSTILNDVIAGDHCKVSALAFRSEGTVLAPTYSLTPNNYIMSPIHNRTFKGNVVFGGTNYYYGDFNLTHRTEANMIGDYLIFKPLLYNIPTSFPYGVHDFVITLHYSYT